MIGNVRATATASATANTGFFASLRMTLRVYGNGNSDGLGEGAGTVFDLADEDLSVGAGVFEVETL